IRRLFVFALWECCIRFEIVSNVCASALNKVLCELSPNTCALRSIQVSRETCELGIEETQKRSKGVLITAVWGGCHEHKVPRSVRGDASQQVESLLSSSAHSTS